MERASESDVTTSDPEQSPRSDSGESSGLSSRFAIAGLIAASGIVSSGVLVYVLDRIGPAGAADLAWIVGYGATIFALWYLVIRPIDFSERYAD